MRKNVHFTDLVAAALMLGGLSVAWALSDWSNATTAVIVITFIVLTCAGIWATRLQRKNPVESKAGTPITDPNTDERYSDLLHHHQRTENELVALKERFNNSETVKERFLANISHEIRTPMNGIFGMTELLAQTPLSSKQRRYSESIRRSTESLLNIVNDVLDFSKIQSGELKLEYCHFNLGDLLEDVCDLYADAAQQRGLELICDVPATGSLIINGDPARVRQILNNLVSNAIKFTEHGEVVVRTSANSLTNELEISVIDSGIGIPCEIQDNIFDEFTQADSSTTRRYGGTGLGLSIAKMLVSLMGGEIKLNSKTGVGSTFSFTANLVRVRNETEPSVFKPFTNLSALIVDDNDTNSAILAHQLDQWGIKAVTVDSGRAALRELELSVQNHTIFDLAILDLHMPEMDGLELAKQIQRDLNYAPIKLMMLTSSLTNLTNEELHGIGISFALTKPARQTALYEAISAMADDTPCEQTIELDKTFEATDRPKILLTEDNPINQEVACIMLESIGCEVDVAENGEEAVDALTKKQFDLIFMDCQMPVMDGFEATRTIRSQSTQNKIPVVALTANAMEGDRERCMSSGMDDYLSKPVKQTELQSTIEKWIPKQPSAERTNIKPKRKASNNMNYEFDESALDAIKALQRPGKPDILAKIVNMYLEKTPELIADIENGIAANDAARVKMAAHTLKSSSAYLGGKTLSTLCNNLEAKASNEDLSDTADDVPVISAGFEELCNQINKFA